MKRIFIILTLFLGILAFPQDQMVHIEDLVNQGKVFTAMIQLKERISVNKNDEEALLLLGNIHSNKENWDAALIQYARLLELQPKKADYHFKYGGALGLKALNISRLRAVTLLPDVRKHLEKAAALDPSHIGSRRALVELYMQLPGILGGSEEKAEKYAKELNSYSRIDALLASAYIDKLKGNKNQAQKLYQEAFKIHSPGNSGKRNYLNYQLGEIAAENKLEPIFGIELLNKYLANYSYLDIRSPEWAHYRKAQIYVNMGEKEEAKRSIEKALAIKEDFEEAKKERVRILKL